MPFTARQPAAAFADARGIAVGQRLDECVGVGQTCSVNNLLLAGVGFADQQVVEYRAGEQRDVLKDHRYVLLQLIAADLPRLDAANS